MDWFYSYILKDGAGQPIGWEQINNWTSAQGILWLHLDYARDRTAITQEELNSHLSEQMNKTMYILSIVAAIFLPLGLSTGLLGINVGAIPGTDNKFAFVFGSMFLVAFAFVQIFIFKRKKWL
ncbi:CorA family divalent cation transporter [Sulfurirhabdus autotrophica]|uniref:CorA-like Mg2+ transporter protein n=1 Tax=Sulfurirhabdus autotrophica TaxID=1706046 RepID=A0A4R3YGE0_9PROT|nr:CorA family divalent cation transporter [Sulfurirhabdus autotrophica]TCV90288.1 CorA-like Mg2+ transporter protein [Sulfurirhabdus autotrophica]